LPRSASTSAFSTPSSFALGAALAGFAGAMIGALQSVQVGMGEPVLILAFVVIVIGGIGSIRGALVASLIVGLVDTMGRFLLPTLLSGVMEASAARGVGSALASMLIYLLDGGGSGVQAKGAVSRQCLSFSPNTGSTSSWR
jgi:branched-subunit amino acid ABC-type transport system permease component